VRVKEHSFSHPEWEKQPCHGAVPSLMSRNCGLWRRPWEIVNSGDKGSAGKILGIVILASTLMLSGCSTGPPPNAETQALYWDDGAAAPSEAYSLALANASCETELLTWYLTIGWPIGREAVPGQYSEIVYVQDKLGLWSGATAGEWAVLSDFPDDAAPTSLMTQDGHSVWISPEDPPLAVYLAADEGVERWPRLDGACG